MWVIKTEDGYYRCTVGLTHYQKKATRYREGEKVCVGSDERLVRLVKPKWIIRHRDVARWSVAVTGEWTETALALTFPSELEALRYGVYRGLPFVAVRATK